MAVPDPFLTAAMAFLLGCSSMYKDNVVPINVTLRTVNFVDGKVNMYLYENTEMKEEIILTDGITDEYNQLGDIQVQMEEKGDKLVVGGQGISVKGQCRPFHLDTQNKFIVVYEWTTCSSRVFYMLDDKIHAIGCNDSWDEILNSGLLDLNGKVLQNTNVKQTSMECRTDIGVDATKKVFVFEKDGCKQLGGDMKTWTQPATECTKDKISLTPGVKSPLYSLRYLLTVYGSECKKESESLSSQGRWVDNTYVNFIAKKVENKEPVKEESPGEANEVNEARETRIKFFFILFAGLTSLLICYSIL